MQGEERGLVVRGRVEIDTRQPFRSVKEAVMLFGEKVLAGEICATANKLKEMQSKESETQNEKHTKFAAVTAELEETKQSLQKAKQEGNHMARHLTFLRQELEQTRKELHHLKSGTETSQFSYEKPEIEEIKFVENTSKLESNKNDGYEFIERKRSVKFANPPMLTKVIVNGDEGDDEKASIKKKNKKRPMIPVLGRLFSKGEQRKS